VAVPGVGLESGPQGKRDVVITDGEAHVKPAMAWTWRVSTASGETHKMQWASQAMSYLVPPAGASNRSGLSPRRSPRRQGITVRMTEAEQAASTLLYIMSIIGS